MEKQFLQQEIRATLNITQKYDGMLQEANDAIFKYKPIYLKRILLILLSIGFFWIDNNFNLTFQAVWLGVVVAIVIGIPLYITVRIYAWIKHKESLMRFKKLKKHAEHFLESNLERVEIPKVFCNTNALNRFTHYLDNFLAENLKECANLYHREQENEKILQGVQTLRNEISEAKRAAQLAAEEAASAHAAANEASYYAINAADEARSSRHNH